MDTTNKRLNGSGLNEIWMKAAVAGSLWASFEIIVGSLLHNLRLPFAGTILTSFAVIFLVAFSRTWPERGILWRAGLICALMKSVSPSAVILGPMIGIFTEALIMEIMIRIGGRNLLAWTLGGALAVLSALVHKIVNLLLLYGFDIVEIYSNMFTFASRQLGMEESKGITVLLFIALIYAGAGIMAALAGYNAGGKALRIKKENRLYPIDNKIPTPKTTGFKTYLPLLFFHFLILIMIMTILSPSGNLLLQSVITLVYTTLVILYYPRVSGKLLKPFFWIQLLVIMIIAGLFLEGTRPEEFNLLTVLANGAGMMLRALMIITSFSAISIELSNPRIRKTLIRKGFHRAYLALQLSFSALPSIIERNRIKKKKNPLTAFYLLLADAENWLNSFREEYESGRKPERTHDDPGKT